MRLSDVKGERTFEVIAEIVDPIGSIAEDEAVAEFFKREPVPKGKTAGQVFVGKVRKALPIILREHRDDIVRIFAAIDGTPPAEYLERTDLKSLANDVFELITDEEFLAFLPSGKTEDGSGTSSENTEE